MLKRGKKREGKAALPSRKSGETLIESAGSLRQPVPRKLIPKLRYYVAFVPRHLSTVILLCALIACAVVFWQYLYQSTYFHVQDWTIIGNERLTEDEIKTLVAENYEEEKIGLLSFQTHEAEERLSAHPIIYHGFVRKQYPMGLQVVLQERHQRALVVATNGCFLADIEGVLMSRASMKEMLDERLPILTCEASFEVGEQLPEEFISPAMLYAETMSAMHGELSGQLSEVNWSKDKGITLFLRGGTKLICGTLDPAETLPRAEALAEKLGGLSEVDYADLRLKQDLPWRSFDATEQLAAANEE